MSPGETTFTRMPRRATSNASDFTMLTVAALTAAYAAILGAPVLAAREPIHTKLAPA
jgi:hypothetical protein